MDDLDDRGKAARGAALEELGDAWRQMSISSRRLRGRDAMQEGSLSVPQFMLLSKLLDVCECASGELAQHAGMTAATATHMLGQLERDGVVQRERSTTDRRGVITRLTPKGRRLVELRDAVLTNSWTEMVTISTMTHC